MLDDVSRLVWIEGLGVAGLVDVGGCLLIGVELLVPARRSWRSIATRRDPAASQRRYGFMRVPRSGRAARL
jgi:hypothetical protein